jgi:hypothetical protein
MLYALSWFMVLLLLALWSLSVWALNALAVWTLSGAGQLSLPTAGTEALALPAWLAPWVPPELVQAIASTWAAFGPAVEWLLQAVPLLAGGVSILSWVVWALGSLLLLLLGGGLHLLIALLRRKKPGSDLPMQPVGSTSQSMGRSMPVLSDR